MSLLVTEWPERLLHDLHVQIQVHVDLVLFAVAQETVAYLLPSHAVLPNHSQLGNQHVAGFVDHHLL